ncbi:MAG: helix-turn-helix transcriptional regulator [bacterium]
MKAIKTNSISLDEFIKKQNYTKEELKNIENKSKYYSAVQTLKEMREKMGMTQEELSKKSGIPRSAISKIESGKRNVTIEKLVLLASAMDKKMTIQFS